MHETPRTCVSWISFCGLIRTTAMSRYEYISVTFVQQLLRNWKKRRMCHKNLSNMVLHILNCNIENNTFPILKTWAYFQVSRDIYSILSDIEWPVTNKEYFYNTLTIKVKSGTPSEGTRVAFYHLNILCKEHPLRYMSLSIESKKKNYGL